MVVTKLSLIADSNVATSAWGLQRRVMQEGSEHPAPGHIDPVRTHRTLNRFWNGKACARMEKIGMLRHDIGVTAVLDRIDATDRLPACIVATQSI